MPKITTFGEYRGYIIAGQPAGIKGLWQAIYSGFGMYIESCVLSDNRQDCEKLAKELVDYQYKIDYFQAFERRKYDPMKDGCLK